MTEITVGVLIGLTTSMLAGLLLMWKGNHTIAFLQRLPASYRISVTSQAYRRALQSYPYRFVHLFALVILFLIQVAAAIGYAFLTYLSFALGAEPPDVVPSTTTVTTPSVSGLSDAIGESVQSSLFMSPWATLFVTIVVAVFTWYFVKKLIVEAIVPFAHRDFTTIRDLVGKFATKRQFVKYIENESAADSTEALMVLLGEAQELIKEGQVNFIQDMLANISVRKPVHHSQVVQGSD